MVRRKILSNFGPKRDFSPSSMHVEGLHMHEATSRPMKQKIILVNKKLVIGIVF